MAALNNLPREVLDMVLQHLTKGDLKNLNRTSRHFWAHASRYIWEEVNGFNKLFRLMTGKSILPRNVNDRVYRRKELARRLPSTFNPAQFQRFEAYAPFVKTLYVQRGVLSGGLHRELVNKRPLLPNLRTLFVSKRPHEEWYWEPCANDVEDLLLLFLNKSVQRFAIHCDRLALCPKAILQWAPYLTDMRVSCSQIMTLDVETAPGRSNPRYDWAASEPIGGLYLQPTVGEWSTSLAGEMKSWNRLSHLTINGSFIDNQRVLERIAQVPRLEYLCVVEPEESFWGTLESGVNVFPKLATLALYQATREGAESVFHCSALLNRVNDLEWQLNRRNFTNRAIVKQWAGALLEMARGTTNLGTLRINTRPAAPRCPILSNPEIIPVFSALHLSRLYIEEDLHALQYDGRCFTALSSFGPRLTHLSMKGVKVPMQLFSRLFPSYPALVFLRCLLDRVKYPVSTLDRYLAQDQPSIEQHESEPITLQIALAATIPEEVALVNPDRLCVDNPEFTLRHLTKGWPQRELILVRDIEEAQNEKQMQYLEEMQVLLGSYRTGVRDPQLAEDSGVEPAPPGDIIDLTFDDDDE